MLKVKKIVVTGANGQLGSEIRTLSEQLQGFVFLFTDYDTLDITDEAAVKDFLLLTVPSRNRAKRLC